MTLRYKKHPAKAVRAHGIQAACALAVATLCVMPSELAGQVGTTDRPIWGLREAPRLMDDVMQVPQGNDAVRWLVAPTIRIGEYADAFGVMGGVLTRAVSRPFQIAATYRHLRSPVAATHQFGLRSKLILRKDGPALAAFTDVGLASGNPYWAEIGLALGFQPIDWLAVGGEMSSAWIGRDDHGSAHTFVLGYGARAELGTRTTAALDARVHLPHGTADEIGLTLTHVLLSDEDRSLLGSLSYASSGGLLIGAALVL